jgi:hypothetical protein
VGFIEVESREDAAVLRRLDRARQEPGQIRTRDNTHPRPWIGNELGR